MKLLLLPIYLALFLIGCVLSIPIHILVGIYNYLHMVCVGLVKIFEGEI